MNQTEIVNIFTKKTLALTFVLSAAAMAFAQEKAGITGMIVNKQNQPVPYASVTFSNKANKSLSDAVLTDEKGQYKLELAPGNYDITVEAIDYKKSIVNKNIAGAGNIGALSIQPEATTSIDGKTQEIQGVVITAAATKPYKVELDKRTYDPSQDIVSKGGNLQDVLSNVPSVSVDTDGTVSMRGSSNVRFLINGKPSALLGIDDGANALQSIPADQIDRIEVITNPSSKFEASGTAGILNIILKKSKKTGFNGSVIGTLGYLPQTNLNANLNWRKGNFTWFLNGGGGYRESKNTTRTDDFFTNAAKNSDLVTRNQDSETKSKNNNYNASAGIVYDISEKTSVNASGTVRTFDSENIGNIDYKYSYFTDPNSVSNRSTFGTNNNLAFQGDFGLDHKFDDKGQNLSLSLSLQRSRSYNDTNINETQNGAFLLNNIVNQNTINKSVIGKADYELPIGDNSKLEAGYRIDINTNDYSNDVFQSTVQAPTLSFLKPYTYDATYKETFNAFYLQFKSKIGKLGYQLGVRDELSRVDINYQNLDPTKPLLATTKNYNNLFPSVYLSYEFAKDNQLLVNYTRRIDRPRSFFMIPNPNYNDNQNIFDGNINLNPSYVDSFEFGYSISKKKFTINPTLYYRHQTDDTKMLVFNLKETYLDANLVERERIVSHTKPINLGTDDRFGLDLNFNWDATSWLKFLGNVDLFGYNTKGSTLYDTFDKDGKPIQAVADFNGKGFSTRARLSSTIKVDKTFSFQVQGFYRGAQNTAYQDRKDMYAINFGASKTIWKGDGTLAFNVQDIFNTRSMRSTTYTANSVRDSYMQWQPRQFSVSLTYRFKQGEKVEQPKRKKDINSNATGDDQQAPM
ncbi:TonB-dependent receptor domain-containing protein [Chryseobacterium vrystaatense]|uniref:Outer membrane receptor proteins, mostly Fe transport n=1 Tax=Chryseobacterium vrystaatense TaxID=307480 RepID=A0A1M5BPA9_9FLAO|nr:TonB-dependent receptor [Chryseobacterium vrystaatense]SHF44067.1 Outer membrane receptor proteins, mostly Fe transport [Chryseobacterium vrystaatense]